MRASHTHVCTLANARTRTHARPLAHEAFYQQVRVSHFRIYAPVCTQNLHAHAKHIDGSIGMCLCVCVCMVMCLSIYACSSISGYACPYTHLIFHLLFFLGTAQNKYMFAYIQAHRIQTIPHPPPPPPPQHTEIALFLIEQGCKLRVQDFDGRSGR